MAPVGGQEDGGNSFQDGTTDLNDSQNIWATILSEVQSSSTNKLPAHKNVLVLGENEAGKTTLIAKLRGLGEPKKGSGMEYMYLDVKDDYRDDQTRLGAWIMDGDLRHRGLLKFALPADTFTDRIVILVASMTEPWTILESLKNWAEVLSTHIDRLKIPVGKQKKLEESLVRHFQEYVEPVESSPGNVTSPPRRGGAPNPLHPTASRPAEDNVLLPLGENTLTNNLGIPIVVVITKSDAISVLEKEHDYREEHFDFIQQHIRKFCLSYGASLFYTSVKENKNCDVLFRYLVHRIYGFPFNTPANVVERDSVFIPAGWDNEKKISILYENMSSMKSDDPIEDVIVKPVTRKVIQRDVEVSAEDEQLFLLRLQTQLSKQPTPSGQRESPMRQPSGPKQTSPHGARPPGASPVPAANPGSPPKKPGEGRGGAGAGNEGVLANFFNSLLSKKPGQSPTGRPGSAGGGTGSPATTGGSPGVNPGANRDAAVNELERIHRASKKVTSQTTSNSTS